MGTVWPLPEALVLGHLKGAEVVLFFEEIEPFLEDQTKILAAQHWDQVGPIRFLGKRSGDVPWVEKSRGMGEMDPDVTSEVLAKALNIPFQHGIERLKDKMKRLPDLDLPTRLPSLCAGCPHRASYWAIKTALALDGRDGFALGDIGCYTLGVGPSGFYTLRTAHSMGSGMGLASGFGKLKSMGFKQPVVGVIGDSTFYHAGIPPLINAQNNGSQYLCIILDNETTAMTGHQPHPGSHVTALGETAYSVPLTELIKRLDIPVTIRDPYEVEETTATILNLLDQGGLQVLVLQRACALVAAKEQERRPLLVDQERCLGDACGCDRVCSRLFSCPANVWDDATGKARIDEVICTGCGVCASVCPQGAIVSQS